MSDLFSAIGQGLGAVGGPLVSGGLNLVGGLLQQSGQQSSIQQQEQFQQGNSNTAYQRSVADMTKAGLNPALMYGSGGPESTPSGSAMAPPNVLGGVASSAMDAMTAQKQMQVMDSTIGQNLANTALTTAKIPSENLEGHLATTMQGLIGGIENFVQGWSKNNASPGGLNKLSQSIKPNANNGPSLGDDLFAGLNPFSQNFMNPGKWESGPDIKNIWSPFGSNGF